MKILLMVPLLLLASLIFFVRTDKVISNMDLEEAAEEQEIPVQEMPSEVPVEENQPQEASTDHHNVPEPGVGDKQNHESTDYAQEIPQQHEETTQEQEPEQAGQENTETVLYYFYFWDKAGTKFKVESNEQT